MRWSAVRHTAIALALAASAAEGQAVRVRAVLERTRAPVVGALVSLRDLSGGTVGQALTNENGRALVPALSPGRYVVRIDRIGFGGTTTEAVSIGAADTIPVSVVLSGVRVALPDVVVMSSRAAVCKLSQEQGTSLAALWGEARKALEATEFTRSSRPPLLDVTKYERTLDARLQVANEQVTNFRTSSVTPFVTAAPERLSRDGYVARDGAVVTFFAPDAAVLLSEVFLGDHCFQVVASPRDPALVGLAFEPVASRKVPDVVGTLWVDRSSSELRFLEFRYANLSEDVRTGLESGRVDFSRLANGGWIVSRWNVRVGHREGGGEVTPVATESAARVANRAVVTGTVFDSLAGAPLGGVVVSLAGGAYADTTDPSGLYRIDLPTEGDFIVTWAHHRFQALGMPVVSSSARLVRGTTARVDFAVPGARTLTAAACARRPPDPGSEALVIGRLADSLGQGAAGRVEARWAQVPVLRPGYRTTIGERGMTITLYTDPGGRFRLCGVPAGAAVVVTGISQGRRATLTATPEPGAVVAMELLVR